MRIAAPVHGLCFDSAPDQLGGAALWLSQLMRGKEGGQCRTRRKMLELARAARTPMENLAARQAEDVSGSRYEVVWVCQA